MTTFRFVNEEGNVYHADGARPFVHPDGALVAASKVKIGERVEDTYGNKLTRQNARTIRVYAEIEVAEDFVVPAPGEALDRKFQTLSRHTLRVVGVEEVRP